MGNDRQGQQPNRPRDDRAETPESPGREGRDNVAGRGRIPEAEDSPRGKIETHPRGRIPADVDPPEHNETNSTGSRRTTGTEGGRDRRGT